MPPHRDSTTPSTIAKAPPSRRETLSLRRRALPLTLPVVCLALATLGQGAEATAAFRGVVHHLGAPVGGATVRIQTKDTSAVTDSLGRFTLTAPGEETVVITAWSPGFYIGGGLEHQAGESDIEIALTRHGTGDCTDYEWVSAFAEAGEKENCENCHASRVDSDRGLPFDQWRLDAHARSVRNIHFLTMYLGTDVQGNQSPATRYRTDRDYGTTPIRPAGDQLHYGPGYKLDFPTTAGNCGACHAPMAAIDDPYGVDPSRLKGVEAEGISCDLCHKVTDVLLDPATGLPFDNRPGVLSFEFSRPPSGHQFFAGPFDDVAPGEDAYSPVQKQSQYCAPCHSAEFWGVEIYNSYGEWLSSPYAAPDSITTCQGCHMPTGTADHFARIEEGGRRRAPETMRGHRMPGAKDEDLLRDAVNVTARAEFRGGEVEVAVEVVNSRTGHHVPTGSPLRQLILVVQAHDDRGAALGQLRGPRLPDWCGVGDPERGYLAGLAGTAYAKILEQLWTGVSPTAAYWTQTRIASDNRIPAFGADTTTYTFEAPVSGDVTVDVQLLYRRAFIELSDLKGWGLEDILMAHETVAVVVS